MIKEHFQGHPLVYDPAVDRIDWKQVHIKDSLSCYKLPVELQEIQNSEVEKRKSLGQIVFNGKCIGLKTDLFEDDTSSVELQEIEFFSSLATHEAYAAHPEKIGDYIFKEDELISLANNRLPNTIGFSCLLVCSDGMVPLHQIGLGNSVESNSVGISGAGSANPSYFQDDSFYNFITLGMESEIQEESGLPEEAKIETKIIGFARLLHRAGLPQFYGVSHTEASLKDLQPIDESEKDFVERRFFAPLEELLETTPENSSHALEVTLDRVRKSGLVG